MKEVKNIIFDLGGVIINLDYALTIEKMTQLSGKSFSQLYTQAKQHPLFDLFEIGKITEQTFFNELSAELNYDGDLKPLMQAWDAMLLDIPEQRLDVLVAAKQNYNTFLLSNTNETHISSFEKELYKEHGVKNFGDYFDKTYYSCRVGLRKPNAEIFELVLKENKLNKEETIFIDDSIQHVQGAGACGIRAYLLQKNMDLEDLLKELKLL
ncbi:MAG: HAD family phosphatase [Sphingobacteriaceae bacterium]|nr:HAD family phosphatase [Sphingobacteriaceae bacterium]